MLTFVKAVLIPGSLAFLLTGLIISTVLLYGGPGSAWLGRAAITVLAGGYVLLATPAVSNWLLGRLQTGFGSIEQADAGGGARVLVVLGNGAVSYVAGDRAVHQLVRRTAYCVLEGARLHDLLKPSWVVLSGGVADPRAQTRPECEIMHEELGKMGVPFERILMESVSRTTDEQIAAVAGLLRERELGDRIILVTTPAHMRRAIRLAKKYRLEAIPSVASKLRYGNGESGWRRWRPSVGALAGSESAMYECLALARTWMRRNR